MNMPSSIREKLTAMLERGVTEIVFPPTASADDNEVVKFLRADLYESIGDEMLEAGLIAVVLEPDDQNGLNVSFGGIQPEDILTTEKLDELINAEHRLCPDCRDYECPTTIQIRIRMRERGMSTEESEPIASSNDLPNIMRHVAEMLGVDPGDVTVLNTGDLTGSNNKTSEKMGIKVEELPDRVQEQINTLLAININKVTISVEPTPGESELDIYLRERTVLELNKNGGNIADFNELEVEFAVVSGYLKLAIYGVENVYSKPTDTEVSDLPADVKAEIKKVLSRGISTIAISPIPIPGEGILDAYYREVVIADLTQKNELYLLEYAQRINVTFTLMGNMLGQKITVTPKGSDRHQRSAPAHRDEKATLITTKNDVVQMTKDILREERRKAWEMVFKPLYAVWMALNFVSIPAGAFMLWFFRYHGYQMGEVDWWVFGAATTLCGWGFIWIADVIFGFATGLKPYAPWSNAQSSGIRARIRLFYTWRRFLEMPRTKSVFSAANRYANFWYKWVIGPIFVVATFVNIPIMYFAWTIDPSDYWYMAFMGMFFGWGTAGIANFITGFAYYQNFMYTHDGHIVHKNGFDDMLRSLTILGIRSHITLDQIGLVLKDEVFRSEVLLDHLSGSRQEYNWIVRHITRIYDLAENVYLAFANENSANWTIKGAWTIWPELWAAKFGLWLRGDFAEWVNRILPAFFYPFELIDKFVKPIKDMDRVHPEFDETDDGID